MSVGDQRGYSHACDTIVVDSYEQIVAKDVRHCADNLRVHLDVGLSHLDEKLSLKVVLTG